jgi:uncharacterized protein with HEPN domain
MSCLSPLENKGFRNKSIGIASLPSKNPAFRLEDIVEQAGYIAEYIARMDEAAFQKDRKTRDAVERCIERVIEATTKLDEETKARLGDHPWKDLRGMGNWLRHGYDRVAPDIVWDVACNKIPRLAADCEKVLMELRAAS